MWLIRKGRSSEPIPERIVGVPGSRRFPQGPAAQPGRPRPAPDESLMASDPVRRHVAVVSHLPCRLSGGGMYAVTWHVWQQILKRFPGSSFLHVTPPDNFSGMLKSRFLRKILGRPGDFFPFAPGVLSETSKRVEACLPETADAVLFRSSTRWIRCRPAIPYFVHTDACFHTYCCNKNAESQYRKEDLQRIWDEEAAFLEAAQGVFFESRWAMERAVAAYGLRGRHYHCVGVAGGLEAPTVAGGTDSVVRLLSIANRFRQKGGDIIYDAFKLLQPRYPQLKWHIVGDRPDYGVVWSPGIVYEGPLNPESVIDMQRYSSLLASSSLLLHPTREDMNPLVLLEAAGYGCPAITVDDFAIPELVEHGKTGLLLTRPVTPDSLAAAIESLILNPRKYLQLRQEARERAIQRPTWDEIGRRMATVVQEVLGEQP